MRCCLLILLAPLVAAHATQLTRTEQGHTLTNIAVWSPDSRWIVYDTRKNQARFDATLIERVNADTGEVQRLYESRHGAACGVVTYHPTEEKVVFILGPENPTPDWTYAPSRRQGVIVDTRRPGEAVPLDAADYAPPFTPGALHGGTHVHVFSPDGRRVSFTYDDELLTRRDENQRNVGISTLGSPVRVDRDHPRNHDGEAFTTLLTRTVKNPRPGSDEISRACEEGWIGNDALAFQGQVTAPDGTPHFEVFLKSLDATPQRRLTFTSDRKFPGLQGPRHWLRSSPDGSQIACLMKDDQGIVQLFLVSPKDGELRQLTHHPWDIASAFTWSPDGKSIAHVMDHSVFLTDATSGESRRLTPRSDDATTPQPHACVFSPDGSRIAYTRKQPSGFDQIFLTSANPTPQP